MLIAHLLTAGIRALAASIILGGALIYAVDGPDSPYAQPIFTVSVFGFFVFWLVFFFIFGRHVPVPGYGSPTERHAEGIWSTGHDRRESGDGGSAGDGGGGDGGQ